MAFTTSGQEARYQGPHGQLIIGTVILPPELPAGQTTLILPSITAVQGTFTGAVSMASMVAGGVTSSGALVLPLGAVTFALSPYVVVQNDVALAVTTAAGNVVINLPVADASNGGRVLVVKKTTPDANTVAVTPNGAQTIDGVAAAVVLAGGAVHSIILQSDGVSNWVVWMVQ